MNCRCIAHRLALAIPLLVGTSFGAAQSSNPRPNIVFILIDDLGWRDLGCYGSSFYETPNINRLAEEGMRFTQAYAAAPVCSPTRASIMTGRSPARVGFTGHITSILRYRFPPNGRIFPPRDHMRLQLEEVTIPEALKPHGYVSAHIGKWHLGPEGHWPKDQGFDINIAGNTHGSPPTYWDPYINEKREWAPTLVTMQGRKPGEYLTDRLTNEAITFIEENMGRPFFCYLTHYAVHTPIQAPDELTAKYKAKLKNDDSQKNAEYAAMIESVDRGIGRILATLDRLKLTKETIVIFFSDNGGLSNVTNNAPLRAGKQTLYEGGIRVPLIVKWPGKTIAGSVCDTPVISDDLLPTILKMTGRSSPVTNALDGTSIVPLLSGQDSFPKRMLHWYYPHYAREPGAVIRDGDFKLIEFYDPPRVELYNLASDLGEEDDLSEKMPARVKRMRNQITDWLNEVGAKRHAPNPKFDPSQARDRS